MSEGFVPPCDLQAESALLGAMLCNPSAISAVSDIVSDGDFYKSANGRIYSAIIGAWASNTQSADVVTISSMFPDDREYIHHLSESCPVVNNATTYAAIVKRTSTQRELIRAGHEIVQMGHEGSSETQLLLDAAEAKVYHLRPQASEDTKSLRKVADSIVIECMEGAKPESIPTGFSSLDEIQGGMRPGNFIIIGARPGVGKTALALNIAKNVAELGTVAFFSLEMGKDELTERLLCSASSVALSRIRSRDLGPEQLARLVRGREAVTALDMEITDNSALTVLSLKSRARQLASRKRLSLIVVDYLQLLTHGARQESRFVEVSSISRELKALARELHCPVLALSQLNRESESVLGDGKPKLSQLRESGSLEQDADAVILLSHTTPEAGNPETITLHIAKNRHGRVGDVELLWHPRFQRVETF